MVTFYLRMPLDLEYLDEPLGFTSWHLREDGALVEQRAFDSDATRRDIFAVYTLDNEALRADFAYPRVIVSAIRPTTAMKLCPEGFFCGDAKIVALARSPLWRDDERRAAEATAERYGVPLVEFDRLPAVASEYGNPVPEDERPPPGPPPDPGPPEGADRPTEASPPASAGPSPQATTAALAPEPSAPSRAPPRPQSSPRAAGVVTTRSTRRPVGFDPEPARRPFQRRDQLAWLELCALLAALVAVGVGIWLLLRVGWPEGSLPFLLPAAIAIAFGSGGRLDAAISAAIGGVVAALLYLVVAASGSDDAPEVGRALFAMLVVAWFVVVTAFVCAVLATSARRPASIVEKLAALATVTLPVAALVAVGLLGLSAGSGALLIAAVELACLGLWGQTAKREARRAGS